MLSEQAVGNMAARRSNDAFKTRLTWPDVVRVLPEPETRSYALSRFRDSGFDADSFGHRRAAREAMASALTRAEDWLEITYLAMTRQTGQPGPAAQSQAFQPDRHGGAVETGQPGPAANGGRR